jgi:competence protein ComEA
MKRWLVLTMAVLVFIAAGIPPVAAQATKEGPKTTAADATKAADPKKGPLDINTATVEELQALPGIGEAYSKRIVDNRPYKRKDEIVRKAGVPQATYDKIKDQIIAKQTTSEKK